MFPPARARYVFFATTNLRRVRQLVLKTPPGIEVRAIEVEKLMQKISRHNGEAGAFEILRNSDVKNRGA